MNIRKMVLLYKYDIPVGCTTGINPPSEYCRPRGTILWLSSAVKINVSLC